MAKRKRNIPLKYFKTSFYLMFSKCFYLKNLPKQASARSLSLHSSSASKGAVSVCQEPKDCEHLETFRESISFTTHLLKRFSSSSSYLQSSIINSSLPRNFLTPRSHLHRWEFPIGNISCFLQKK